MGVGIIDPLTMEYIDVRRPYDFHVTGISTSYDTGYNTFSYYFNATGYADVYLFFFYIDATSAFWDQNIYVKNLFVNNTSVTNEPSGSYPQIIDSTPPSIYGSNDFTIEEGSEGVIIEWIISDASLYGHYWIYMNNNLFSDADWDSPSGEIGIVIGISHLSVGVYNFTIVVSDAFENYATHTVIVTITSPTLTTPTSTKTTIPQTTLLSISWILIPLSLFAKCIFFTAENKMVFLSFFISQEKVNLFFLFFVIQSQ